MFMNQAKANNPLNMLYFNFREEKMAEGSPKHFHKYSPMQAKYLRESFVFLCLGY